MSHFLESPDNFSHTDSGEIVFDSALRMPGGGSTCDIFRTRWQRREVFVKRLKEEFRSKPIYLDALDKEFDVGVSLHHPSLPEYREFHRDYIVMDYVDGQTLSEMIRRNDPWLSDRRNIVKILRQLVDVVDYLHRHNVIHCDIKPDNIIITARSKNLVLIDFDKSYTDALNDTSGHPGKYGLSIDDKGRTSIDFHGMGRVVERLNPAGFSKFIKECYAPDANCEKLTQILSKSDKNKADFLKIAATLIALTLITTLIFLPIFKGETQESNQNAPQPPAADTLKVTETATFTPAVTNLPDQPIENRPAQPIAQDETPEQAAQIIVASLEMSLSPYFNDLTERLDRLDRLRNDSTITYRQYKERWGSYNAYERFVIDEMLNRAVKLCPDVKDSDIGDFISATDSWRKYIKRAKEVKNEFVNEMERRRDNE